MTSNEFGRGAAYYLGTRPDERYVGMRMHTVCGQAGVSLTVQAPHGDEAAEVRLPVPGRDLFTDQEHDAMLTVEPLGVAVLREEQRA